MALIDVVQWESTPEMVAWKYPETNLSTFTQLIVRESQEAIFVHKGKFMAKFGPGTHTLSTENIPILRELFGIPFGGKNPFTAEVWFVNKQSILDVKWGTSEPFLIRDPKYSVVIPVRANGQFGIQITDSESFLFKLIGALPTFDVDQIRRYFKGALLSNATTIIGQKITEQQVSVLDIAAQISELSEYMEPKVAEVFSTYGIGITNFYINHISVPEEDSSVVHLRATLSKRAEMDILGYSYQQERSFDVLNNAAQNKGVAGDMMGVGLGLGMGVGVGGTIAPMMQNITQSTTSATKHCLNCKKEVDATALFCPLCGQSFAASSPAHSQEINCDKCGKPILPNAKFCPHCGDTYNPCPKCGYDTPTETTQCPKCGETLPCCCKKCHHKVSPEASFCPHCGSSLKNRCPKCNKENATTASFCVDCGTQL